MDDRMRNLTRLWMSAQPIVASFVSSMVPDFNARDDILQEIITVAIEQFDSYDPTRPFVAWVLGIARIQVAVYRRNSSRNRVCFDESTVDLLVDSFAQVTTNDVLKLEFLQSCLERLSDRDRQLCDLRYERDMKPAGIARQIGTGSKS